MKKKLRKFKIQAILRALCPSCHKGKVTQGIFGIQPKCLCCGYNFIPESGFYMGAMVVSFFLTAVLTVPPLVLFKFLNVDMEILIALPFIEFLFLGTFLMFYSRILWLHLEYQMTNRLDGENSL